MNPYYVLIGVAIAYVLFVLWFLFPKKKTEEQKPKAGGYYGEAIDVFGVVLSVEQSTFNKFPCIQLTMQPRDNLDYLNRPHQPKPHLDVKGAEALIVALQSFITAAEG